MMSPSGERAAPVASVVVPCFNASGTLERQLDALASQSFGEPYEVIVADNRSTDESLAIARRYAERYPHFKVVEARRLQGAGYARNVGVASASSGKILFCDADDMVSPGWLASMSAALDRSAMVGGGRDYRLLNPEWHPALKERPRALDDVSLCDVHFHTAGGDRIAHCGAENFGIRRAVFEEVGGFDPDLLIHEDVDLCLRARRRGHSLAMCPEALVHIQVRLKLGAVFRQVRTWGYRNVALLKKHRATLGRPAVLRPLLGWVMLLLRIARVRDRGTFALWLYRLGWKTGRLLGSFGKGFFAP